jgi:hypothetical protein
LYILTEVVYYVRNKLIVSIPTGFNCNIVLGCPGFKRNYYYYNERPQKKLCQLLTDNMIVSHLLGHEQARNLFSVYCVYSVSIYNISIWICEILCIKYRRRFAIHCAIRGRWHQTLIKHGEVNSTMV